MIGEQEFDHNKFSIVKKVDYEITDEEREALRQLLSQCFKDYYSQRIFHKQVPHFRLLGLYDDQIIAQLGIDYRVVNIAGKSVPIFGIIDLCVDSRFRKKKIAGQLLLDIEKLAKASKIDCIFLFADDKRIYKKYGYQEVEAVCRWLAIEDLKSLDVFERNVSDILMVKPLTKLHLDGNVIDMLGYLF